MELGAFVQERSSQERRGIQERYPDIRFPQPQLEPVFYGRREKFRIDGKKAIVDQADKDLVFGICSEDYKVVHYEDLIMMTEEVMAKQGFMVKMNPRILSNGGKFVLSLQFPDYGESIRKGDDIFPKMDIQSSYDLKWKLTGRFGAIQLRCTNGCGTWKMFKRFARRHLQSLIVSELGDTISEALPIFTEQAKLWKKWAHMKVPVLAYEEMWADLPFSPAQKEKIQLLPEIGTGLAIDGALKRGNLDLWTLNSILTQYATHELKSDLKMVEIEPVIAKVMEDTYEKLAA
jgi:hypothetical protein